MPSNRVAIVPVASPGGGTPDLSTIPPVRPRGRPMAPNVLPDYYRIQTGLSDVIIAYLRDFSQSLE
jgi:hypothetical protein